MAHWFAFSPDQEKAARSEEARQLDQPAFKTVREVTCVMNKTGDIKSTIIGTFWENHQKELI